MARRYEVGVRLQGTMETQHHQLLAIREYPPTKHAEHKDEHD